MGGLKILKKKNPRRFAFSIRYYEAFIQCYEIRLYDIKSFGQNLCKLWHYKYINEIFQFYMKLSTYGLFQSNGALIFQQDLAPFYVANVCKKLFQDNHFQCRNSPDLNSIGNL